MNHSNIHPAILEYEETYERSLGGWREDGAISYASVELEVGRLWHALVLLLRPRMVLETGTFKGYSTACIASALDSLGGGRRVITIDPAPQEGQVWAGTELERVVTLRRQLSQDAYPDLFLSGTRFDMLVLDSDHHYDTIMTELMLYEPLLNVGGAILLHDSLFFDGVGVAVRQVLANPRFQGLTLDSPRQADPGQRCPGVTIIRKERDGTPELQLDSRYLGWEVGDPYKPALLRTP
ncbi:class I SAM-dependent methyltransferase [Tundrisphaera sp. TA3]|uniref:class I SAM-dependent methyltransferase n=1 Tax=Tundrisphaera sp. TA3 TaxID=3435775 RepID=UPI003EBC7132